MTDKNTMSILQLKHTTAFNIIRFQNMHGLEKMGIRPDFDSYDTVYSEPLQNYDPNHTLEYLESVFMRFNIDIPIGFEGHPLSVSDVVHINFENVERYFFCDSFGFKELHDFAPVKEDNSATSVPKQWYRVSFKWNQLNSDGFPVFCANIALAKNKETVEEFYSKYDWCAVREASEQEVEAARKRGMPIIKIEEINALPKAVREKESFGIVLMEKPLDEGLTLEEAEKLFKLLHGVKGIPWEVQGEHSSAMGFINLTDAEIIDYDYCAKSEIYKKVREILDDMKKETRTGEYEIQIGKNIIDVLITR